MTVDVNKLAVGAAVVSIGDWVAAAAAGTLTDVGLTTGPAELSDVSEDVEVEGEQVQGVVRSVPTKKTVTLKVPMAEADLDKLQRLLRQPTANLTGTAPNKTLAVDAEEEQYLQVQCVTQGIAGSGGTHATRTLTFWRCSMTGREAVPFTKGGVQQWAAVFKVHQDTSVSAGGSGQFYKIADAGAA